MKIPGKSITSALNDATLQLDSAAMRLVDSKTPGNLMQAVTKLSDKLDVIKRQFKDEKTINDVENQIEAIVYHMNYLVASPNSVEKKEHEFINDPNVVQVAKSILDAFQNFAKNPGQEQPMRIDSPSANLQLAVNTVVRQMSFIVDAINFRSAYLYDVYIEPVGIELKKENLLNDKNKLEIQLSETDETKRKEIVEKLEKINHDLNEIKNEDKAILKELDFLWENREYDSDEDGQNLDTDNHDNTLQSYKTEDLTPLHHHFVLCVAIRRMKDFMNRVKDSIKESAHYYLEDFKYIISENATYFNTVHEWRRFCNVLKHDDFKPLLLWDMEQTYLEGMNVALNYMIRDNPHIQMQGYKDDFLYIMQRLKDVDTRILALVPADNDIMKILQTPIMLHSIPSLAEYKFKDEHRERIVCGLNTPRFHLQYLDTILSDLMYRNSVRVSEIYYYPYNINEQEQKTYNDVVIVPRQNGESIEEAYKRYRKFALLTTASIVEIYKQNPELYKHFKTWVSRNYGSKRSDDSNPLNAPINYILAEIDKPPKSSQPQPSAPTSGGTPFVKSNDRVLYKGRVHCVYYMPRSRVKYIRHEQQYKRLSELIIKKAPKSK